MNLDEALEYWRRERGRLEDIEHWIDAGMPVVPQPIQRSLEEFRRLKKPDGKKRLKQLREELQKDSFLRLFSAFECQLREVFGMWLKTKCGTSVRPNQIVDALPSIEGVLRLASVLEPTLDPSRFGYVKSVREARNSLVHGGFSNPAGYDPEELHTKFGAVLRLFS
jgi:hypothetical protein